MQGLGTAMTTATLNDAKVSYDWYDIGYNKDTLGLDRLTGRPTPFLCHAHLEVLRSACGIGCFWIHPESPVMIAERRRLSFHTFSVWSCATPASLGRSLRRGAAQIR